MIIEIELNDVVDKSISVAVVLLCFFVGMRVLYGYWPWQEGPKRRVGPVKAEADTSVTLKRPEPIAEPALQPEQQIKEPEPNGALVPALAVSFGIDAAKDSFDRSVIKNGEETQSQAA